MKKMTKRGTAKMKAKSTHWKHQGNDGPNSKGNFLITARPNIYPMIDQIRQRKEEKA